MVKLSQQEKIRYARQLGLPGVGEPGQVRLKQAAVLVVGTGGLGCPAALYLAAAGVGRLGLAEFDTVELHNLHRQILHDTAAVGSAKIDSAAARLRAINPECTLTLHRQGVTVDNAVELFRGYDLVVDGSDNFPTRYLNNDAAWFARRPLVYGSIFQFEGQVTVFHPHGGSPCYRCLFPDMPAAGEVPNCAEGGVFGALPGVMGSMQAMEAVKWITGVGDPLTGRLWVLDALAGHSRTLQLKKDPACPLCGASPSITAITADAYVQTCGGTADEAAAIPMELNPLETQALLAATPETWLVDVREPYEWELCRLPAARLMPLGKLPESWHAIPRDRPVVCYCHHGMRSLQAARLLRERGVTGACSLRGGIDAWARELDASVPRY